MAISAERTGEFLGFENGGYVELFVGPMFSGKSDALIYELARAKFAQKKVQVFKPFLDNRRSDNTINSYTGRDMDAISVRSSAEILELADADVDWVGIDEAQFFSDDLPDVCRQLASRGVRVIVAGLSADFRNEPFGPMDALMRDAEVLHKLNAFCNKCGKPASRTQRIVNGIPAHYDDPVVVIGAEESYEARCAAHHEVPGKRKKESKILLDKETITRLHETCSSRFAQESFLYATDYNPRRLLIELRTFFGENLKQKGFESHFFSVLFSDKLAAVDDTSVNRLLQFLTDKGIEPDPNVYGDKLLVATCISEVLELDEIEFQEIIR